MVTLQDVIDNPRVKALISVANSNLEHLGYTEHGMRHVGYVSRTTANILRELGYDSRTIELGAIAGFIHDIGNAVNRTSHGISGAILAFNILSDMQMDATEIALVTAAIGNHEEETGTPVSPIAAALIIADKADAHRSRVRKEDFNPSDIHDRVNHAIKKNYITIDNHKKVIRLVLVMEDSASTMDYIKIYLSRMIISQRASAFLGYWYELVINGSIINRRRPVNKGNALEATETEVSEEGDDE